MKSISIVVPVYYGEKYIEGMICQVETCRRCLNIEDYVELIFVNDAPDAPLSDAWTSELVHITVMNTDKNVGIQSARIKGLRKCCGEYVQFLDQDDLIMPEYLRSQLAAIGKDDASICRAIHERKMWYLGENILENAVDKEYMLGMRCGYNPIASPGQVLIKRSSIPSVWLENILNNRGADDWLLWLCMIAERRSFAFNQDVLFEHIVHNDNFSNQTVEMLRSEQEVVRIVQVKKMFSEEDLILLMDGFFKRNIDRVKVYTSLKMKWDVLDKWMQLKENKVKISECLREMEIQKIAIYGCAALGKYLYYEIKSELEVLYFLDKRAAEMEKEIPVYPLRTNLPKVDCVIVTLIDDAEKVKKELKKIINTKVIVLKDWLMTF